MFYSIGCSLFRQTQDPQQNELFMPVPVLGLHAEAENSGRGWIRTRDTSGRPRPDRSWTASLD
jgi:hypothetical protein